MTVTQQAIHILSLTRDGEELSPSDLSLVQAAINDWLTPEGAVAFTHLFEEVSGGRYRKPWLCGVEHLTRDHQGYVYWKGHNIEHWSMGAGQRSYQDWQRAAKQLADRCRQLEASGHPINSTTVIWKWPNSLTMPPSLSPQESRRGSPDSGLHSLTHTGDSP